VGLLLEVLQTAERNGKSVGAQMRSADEITLGGENFVKWAARPATAGFDRLPVAVLACLVVKGPSEYPLGFALKLGRRKLDRRK